MNSRCPLFILSLGCFLLLPARAANWPGWRGPTGDGLSPETGLPTAWSTTTNVRWKLALPERGNSTPVIWGDKVFLTQAHGKERLLLCLHRQSGKELWRASVKTAADEVTHKTNPYCPSSPVTDGERVIVSFASDGLFCYDLAGKEQWRRELGRQHHIWGNGASPMLYRNLCLLNFGPGERTFLIAVDKQTGKTVWQHDEPGGDAGEKPGASGKPHWIGSWTTPTVIQENGRDALIMLYPQRVVSFDPLTGKENWFCRGLNDLVYTSPLHSGGILVAMGGYNGMALAVRTGGSGDVTATHRLWHHPRTKQRIGSGVIHEGHIYILNDPGVAECFELETGKLVWEQRPTGPGPTGQNWSSLMLAEGRLYAINQGGDCFVIRASPKFELLATNSLGEHSNSSVVPAYGDLFIRTAGHLWCIGEAK